VAGALVVARLGIPWAIGLNALSYFVFAILLLLARPSEQRERPTERVRLRDSLRMVRGNRRLALLLAVATAVSFTLDPVSTVTPAFATRIFHRPDTFAGLLIGAFGTGAVLGSVVPLHESPAPERRIALMLFLFGAGMVGFALIPTLAIAVAMLAAAGVGYLLGQTGATTLLQLGVADRERGRVMALWSIAFLGSRPVASLLDGGLASLFGPRAATVLMAVPTLAAAGVLCAGRHDTRLAGMSDSGSRRERREARA
jgi:Na+/melibiose symporter-like transporter